MDTDFFEYPCARCGTLFCERVHLMNLAVGYVDDEYCLACLAAEHHRDPAGFVAHIQPYIFSRDCFKNPWLSFDATPCPQYSSEPCQNTCFCQ